MAWQGKRIRKAYENLASVDFLALPEAIKTIKSRATAKFDETIEISMNLNIDVRRADQTVRGMVQLPNGTGKNLRVAVFAKDEKAKEALAAGADYAGSDELTDMIQRGEINFDRCIATPDMMVVVGKYGKILGPRGLMPNPKLGTVTFDVATAVKAAKGGQIEYRAEKAGIIHAGVGKASFDEDKLHENIKVFIDTVLKARPAGVKGNFLKKISLSSTMGPSVKIDISEF